jgi:hypothetical protein
MKLHEIATNIHPHQEIKKWLDRYRIENYTIRPDGVVDVDGDGVRLDQFTGDILPIQFGKVSGDFVCSYTNLTSLRGSPQFVGGNFNCDDTKITSLEYAPQSVGGQFSCIGTKIPSLKGAPHSVGKGFYCHSTKITSLEYAPQSVGKGFYCHNTRIISLHDIHKQIKHISGGFYCRGAKTHLLGLLLIDGITGFDIDRKGPIDKIFNKYAGTGDILSAQDELIDAGFIEQARL